MSGTVRTSGRQSPSTRRALLAALVGVMLPPRAVNATTGEVLALATGAREPLISAPGRPGFVEELVREALRRAGHPLRVVPLPHERALANANAGIEDGDLYRAAGFEQDYPNLVQVPTPLIDQDFVALTLRAEVALRGWADLGPYSTAYVTGNKIIERGLQGHGAVTTVRDNELLLGLLAAGRADVVIINRWVGLAAARRLGLRVRVVEPPLARVPMFVYLHRRHEALVPVLAAALAGLRRDGGWQRLHDELLKPLEAAR
jgi:polar amino acid transport system substrate-binding protein